MRDDLFEKTAVSKAVMTLAVPTMASMLVAVIYNLADIFFVGQLNDPDQVAAVAITTPIFLLLMAVGNIFGIGGGAYISRLLGKKEPEQAKNASAFSFYASIVAGCLSAAAALYFMSDILKLSGASAQTYDFAKQYLTVIAFFAPVIVLGFSLGHIIRAEGSAGYAMKGMIIGTVGNIILDPVFIIFLGLGIQGAAIATVIANIISVAYYFWYLSGKETMLSVSLKKIACTPEITKEVFSIGIPASLNSVLMSVSTIVLNNFAVRYGDDVIAALGIVGRLNLFPILLMVGLVQGAQPLIGYNYSSGNRERLNEIMRFTGLAATILGISFAALYYVTGKMLVRIFINDPGVVLLGERFINIMILSLPFLGVLILITITFQAIGAARPSLFLSISRQGFVFLPVLILADLYFGVTGLIFAQPVADLVSVLIAIVLYLKISRTVNI